MLGNAYNFGSSARPVFKINLSTIDYTNITSDRNVPVKYDIIAFDARGTGAEHFRVLVADGEKVELLAMTSSKTNQIFGDDNCEVYNDAVSTPTGDQSLNLIQYEGSDLDIYLNETYYGTLKDDIKSAIIDSEIQQDNFYYDYNETSDPGCRTMNTITYKKGVKTGDMPATIFVVIAVFSVLSIGCVEFTRRK